MTAEVSGATAAEGFRPWPTLNDAERSVMREVLTHGPSPRAEIARRLGVSRASLTRVTRNLLAQGLITEGAVELRGWTGRPSELIEIASDARHFFGVKLTGDAVYAVVTGLGAQERFSIDEPLATHELEGVVAQIARMFERCRTEFPDIVAGGVCLGGDLTQDRQVVVEAHYLGWRNVRLADILTERLGIPIATENDARALTAAEHWFGAGAGCSALAVVTIGAGIGFGFVIEDRLVTGAHGRAGRLDHLIVDTTGPECVDRGHSGCASAYLTSSAITRRLNAAEDYQDAVELARAGDEEALRVFADAGRALGTVLGTVANALDPQKIILTGEGLAVWELAQEHTRSALAATFDAGPDPLDLDVQPFEFDEWARAAAVVGIRATLRF